MKEVVRFNANFHPYDPVDSDKLERLHHYWETMDRVGRRLEEQKQAQQVTQAAGELAVPDDLLVLELEGAEQ